MGCHSTKCPLFHNRYEYVSHISHLNTIETIRFKKFVELYLPWLIPYFTESLLNQMKYKKLVSYLSKMTECLVDIVQKLGRHGDDLDFETILDLQKIVSCNLLLKT